jgi:hypothetical protein
LPAVRIISDKPAGGSMGRRAIGHRRITDRLALVGLLLMFAGCAHNSSASNPDNDQNHGFYGGMTGGYTQP